MKREDRRQHRLIAAIAAVAVFALALAIPLIFAEDSVESILRQASVRAADQSAFKLSHPIEVASEPRVVVTRGTVSIAQPQGAAPLSTRAMVDLLAIGKSVLILHDAEIVVGTNSDVDKSRTVRVDAPLAKALSKSNYSALLIEDGSVRFLLDKGKSRTFNGVDLRLRRVAGDRLVAKGSAKLHGRQLDFETTIGASADNFKAKQLPIRGTVKAGALLKTSFNGLFALGDGGRLIADNSQVSVTDIPAFARWLGLTWPSELGFKSFSSEGKLEWARQIVNFPDGRFQLDGNSAAGTLLVNGSGERPLIDGTLAFDQLDLGSFIITDTKSTRSLLMETVSGSADWLPASIRNMLMDGSLPILRELDIDLRISAKQAKFSDFVVNETAAALSLREGRIHFDLAEMALPAGGRGNILFSLDPSGGVAKCGLRGQLNGVRMENVSDLLLPAPLLTGPADVSIDLSGDWHGAETFIHSLDGRIVMKMANGAKLEGDLPGLLDSMGVNEPPVEGWGAAKTGQTNIETLSAEIAFSNGNARIERFLTEREGHSELAVTGTVDFQGKVLDLSVFPRAKGSETASDQVPSVINISGHWDHPSVVKRPFPNKSVNPVYPENGTGGASPEGTAARKATRG